MSAWSRQEVGWLELETVSSDRVSVQLHDINSSTGKAYKIPMLGSSTEYFLLANRQHDGYYDTYAPTNGLAIWHIDETVGSIGTANNNEFHKRVDLECADGLFSDRGYPGNMSDSIMGGDNLDYWSFDELYTKNGNMGDATDLWGGSYITFTPDTNPSTAGYDGDQQRVFSGISVQNIQALSGGVMQVDIRFLPLAPQGLTATPGDEQVTLRWSAPSLNGGSAITRYEYRYQASGGSWSGWSSVELDTSKTVSGLTNTTAYTFAVRAVNAGGHGDVAVAMATPQVPVVERRPGCPRSFSAMPGNGKVTLSWQEPADLGGSTLSHYAYIWRVTGGSWSAWDSVGTATSAVVTNLTNGTAYDFKVRTFTHASAKKNRSSKPAEQRGIRPTSGPVAPGAPRDLTATPGTGQVSLSWSAPLSDGGSVLTRYEYRYKIGDGGWYGWSSVGLDTSTTKTGLADSTTYTFRVRAVNSQGAGPAVESAPVTTLPGSAGPPGVPQALSATPGSGQVSLSWSAPLSDGGSALTEYEYRYQASGGNWSGWWSVSASTTSKTVTGLAANTEYNFEVRAVNAHGPGTAASRSATTPGSSNVPSAPQNLSATASTGQVSLSWSAPSSDGGSAITRYEYRWRTNSGSWSPWWSVGIAFSKTVTGLSANTTYNFEVRAVNSHGAGASASASATTPAPPPPPSNAPSAPQSLSATASPGQVKLSWSAPSSDGGSAITRYEYQWKEASSSTWSVWLSTGSSTNTTKTGLSANTTYNFQVRARNSHGAGPSASASATTPGSNTPADKPGSVSLTTSSPSVGCAVTATLTDPDGGIYGASWQWLTSSSSGLLEVEGVVDPAVPELSSYTPTNQDIGRRLRATVTYSDKHRTGRTAESALTSAVVNGQKPTAPTNVQVNATVIKKIYILSWSAPSSTGGLPITYEYRRKAGSDTWGSWSNVGTSTESGYLTLESGTTYTFQVRARNCKGPGSAAQKTFTPSSTSSLSLSVSAVPNPFNPQTTVRFELPTAGPVRLVVYNLAGQPVRTLLDGEYLSAGSHAVVWDARDGQGRPVASGMYLLRWTGQGQTILQKITLLR